VHRPAGKALGSRVIVIGDLDHSRSSLIATAAGAVSHRRAADARWRIWRLGRRLGRPATARPSTW
jgi:hypothetical protein